MPEQQHAAILARVEAVMRQVFSLPGEYKVTDATVASDIDGWDSLSHSILIMKIEEEFAVDLPMERVYEVNDVGELVELIASAAGSAA